MKELVAEKNELNNKLNKLEVSIYLYVSFCFVLLCFLFLI